MQLHRPPAAAAAAGPPPRRPGPQHVRVRLRATGGEAEGAPSEKEGGQEGGRPRPGQHPQRTADAAAARAARLRRLKAKVDAELAATLLEAATLSRRDRRTVEEAAVGGPLPQPPGRGRAAPAAALLAPPGGLPTNEEDAAEMAVLLQALESHTGPGWGLDDARPGAEGPAESAAALRARLDAAAARAADPAARAGGPPPEEWRRRLKRAATAAAAAGLSELKEGVVPAPVSPPAVEAATAAAHRALLLLRRGLLNGTAGAFLDPLADAGFLAEEEGGAPASLLAWSDELASGVGAAPWRSLWRGLGAGGCRVEGDAAWVRSPDPEGGGVAHFSLVADFFLHVPAPAWLTARRGGAWRRRGGRGVVESGSATSSAPSPPSSPVAHRLAAFVVDPEGRAPAWAGRRRAAAASAGLAGARAAVAAARVAATAVSAPVPPCPSYPPVRSSDHVLFPAGPPPPPPAWSVAAAVEGWRRRGGGAVVVDWRPLPSAAALAGPTLLAGRPAQPTAVDAAVVCDGGQASLRRVVVWPPRPRSSSALPPPPAALPFRRAAPTVPAPAFDALVTLTPAGLRPKGPGPRRVEKAAPAPPPLPPPGVSGGGTPPPAFDTTPPAARGAAWEGGEWVTLGVVMELTLVEREGEGGPGTLPPLRVAKAVSRWGGARVADCHDSALASGLDVGSVVAAAAGFSSSSDWPLGPTAWPKRAAGAGLDCA